MFLPAPSARGWFAGTSRARAADSPERQPDQRAQKQADLVLKGGIADAHLYFEGGAVRGVGVRVGPLEVSADLLLIEVSDDGVGGATARAAGVLEGLAARVDSINGHITVSSPPGGPTRITMELPCEL